MKSLAALFFCFVASVAANASAVATGNPLPELTVASKGEVQMKGKDLSWQSWSTAKLKGQVQVIQYMAARMTSRKMNKAFTDALDARAFPNCISTTIVNMDDAMWGTSGMVPGELESRKKKFPDSVLVADANGRGLKTWGLEKESSAIIVLDKEGRVIFFKDGSLSKDEIVSTLKLIERNL